MPIAKPWPKLVRTQEALERFRSFASLADAEKGESHSCPGQQRLLPLDTADRPPGAEPALDVAATAALQRFLGRPLTELNARSFLECVHADDAPATGPAVPARRCAKGRATTSASACCSRGGDVRHLQHGRADALRQRRRPAAPALSFRGRDRPRDGGTRAAPAKRPRCAGTNCAVAPKQRRPGAAQGELPRPVPPGPGAVLQPRSRRPLRRLQRHHARHPRLQRARTCSASRTRACSRRTGRGASSKTPAPTPGPARSRRSGSRRTAASSTSGSARRRSSTSRAASSARAAPPRT